MPRVILRIAFTVNDSVFARIIPEDFPRGRPFHYESEIRPAGRKFFKIGVIHQPNIMESHR